MKPLLHLSIVIWDFVCLTEKDADQTAGTYCEQEKTDDLSQSKETGEILEVKDLYTSAHKQRTNNSFQKVRKNNP